MLSFEPVHASDFEALFELRMEAMLPSLRRLGLGERQRSLERFTGQYEPEHMRWILHDGERIGFTKLCPKEDHLHIDHLFIKVGVQGAGAGAWVLDWAKSHGKDLTLSALKLSDSNRFYLRHGFVQIGEGEFENNYRWTCEART